MIEKLGGRKFVAGGIVIVLAVGAVLLKGDVPSNFLTLLEFLFGTFSAANVANTVASLSASKEPEVQGVPVQDAVVAFQQLSGTVVQGLQAQQQSLDTIVNTTLQTQKALSVIAERLIK